MFIIGERSTGFDINLVIYVVSSTICQKCYKRTLKCFWSDEQLCRYPQAFELELIMFNWSIEHSISSSLCSVYWL